MVASALIVLSLAVTVLAVLDFLLSENQKKLVADTVIATWNVLDEARKWSFADWLKNPRASAWLAISLALFYILAQSAMLLSVRTELHEDLWVIPVFISAVFALILAFITLPIFSRLLKLGKRLWYVSIAAGALYALALVLLHHYSNDSEFREEAFAAFLIVGVPAAILFFASLTIFFARFLAYAASGILFVSELIVRRIAEYPKGPIIAISAIFGGLVSLVKMFSG